MYLLILGTKAYKSNPPTMYFSNVFLFGKPFYRYKARNNMTLSMDFNVFIDTRFFTLYAANIKITSHGTSDS